MKNLKETITELFKSEKKNRFEVREGESALRRFARQFTIDGKSGLTPQTFFQAVKDIILKILNENRQTKVKMILVCRMQRRDLVTGEIDEVVADFHSKIEEHLEGTNENELFEAMIARIAESISLFQRRGSNWQFMVIIQLTLHLVDFQPLSGNAFLALPKSIRDKKAILNMKNEDNQCFKWSVTRALNPVKKNAERVTEELKELDWTGLEFPVELKEVALFEKNNSQITVNIA